MTSNFTYDALYELTQVTRGATPGGANGISSFYEVRGAEDKLLKRDGGFATQEAATVAARTEAKKLKSAPLLNRPNVGRLLVGQNMDKPTRN